MNEKSIQKGLEQDARIITERMPKDMTEVNALQKAEALQKFMADRGWSQSKAAKAIGVSPAVINQFLSGKYKGKLKELVNKVVNLINSVSRRESRVKNRPYIETTVAMRIGTLIKQTSAFCDEEGKIGIVVGDSGHGKSHCLRHYAQANKNTVYVELDDAMTSTLMFAEIAKQLNLDSSGSLAIVTRRLIDELEEREIIVMLDEASGLNVRQLNQLRQIIVVKARCPLILAGNSDLLRTVMQPTTKRGFESLDQFTSRLAYILKLDEKAADKGGGLYTVKDIRQLYEYGGIRLTGDGVTTLRKICSTPKTGRLRTCSHIISALLISNVMTKNDGVVDAEWIIAAIRELDLPVRVRLPLTIRDIEEETDQQRTAKTA